MKKLFRWVVIGMCLAGLLSLFGCREPIIRDKTGMVRTINWKSFTISQISDDYSQHYSFTVDKESDGYYLVLEGEYPDFEDQHILLPQETVDQLLAMDLGNFPDVVPDKNEEMLLDGTHQSLVVGEDDTLMRKSVSFQEAEQLRELLESHIEAAY